MEKVELADGSYLRVLAQEEAPDLLGLLDDLDPFADGEPFFDVEAAGEAFVVGPKKYVVRDETGNVIAHTEPVLGGFVPPAGFGIRGPGGRYLFTAEIAGAHAERGDGLLSTLSWEATHPDWPALERHQLSSPEALAEFPEVLGSRPFARVVEAVSSCDDCHPVALDPGGEIADLSSLQFCDARSNRLGEITVDPAVRGAFVVDSLRAHAVEWGRHGSDELPEVVVLDALLARSVGKSGGLFVDGSDQPVYSDVDRAAVLVAAARSLGAAVMAELCGIPVRTARALASGRRPSLETERRAMSALEALLGDDPLPKLLDLVHVAGERRCGWPGCDEIPSRPDAAWCSRHRQRSGKDRARAIGGGR
ncbi:MAG: hypothetical protein M0Z46_12570 [Actinomycetota bacterium]|nr:hypothetical protein [Actinomycetota bacterium]